MPGLDNLSTRGLLVSKLEEYKTRMRETAGGRNDYDYLISKGGAEAIEWMLEEVLLANAEDVPLSCGVI